MMASAQFVVSGNLGFGVSNNKVTYDGTRQYVDQNLQGVTKNTNFGIDLRAGYQINQQLRAGIYVGYGLDKYVTETGKLTDVTTIGTTETTKIPAFQIGAFGRYNCWNWGKLTVFNELELGIATGSSSYEIKDDNSTLTKDGPKTFAFNAAITPGFSYQISEHVAADLYLDFISLYFNTTKSTTTSNDKDYVESNTSFGLKINNMDMSITGFNSNVRMGVSFTF